MYFCEWTVVQLHQPIHYYENNPDLIDPKFFQMFDQWLKTIKSIRRTTTEFFSLSPSVDVWICWDGIRGSGPSSKVIIVVKLFSNSEIKNSSSFNEIYPKINQNITSNRTCRIKDLLFPFFVHTNLLFIISYEKTFLRDSSSRSTNWQDANPSCS